MKKVEVIVYFNGAYNYYYFLMDIESFMKRWHNHLNIAGYFEGNDQEGRYIVINPSNCGTIEIKEVKA